MIGRLLGVASGGSGAFPNDVDGALLPGVGRGRRLFALIAIWTALGLFFAGHFRIYHRVDWSLALWWGLKDWYLWGALTAVVVWLTRRLRVSGLPSIRIALVHAAAAVALAWVHAVLAVFLSSLVEGLGELSFAGHAAKLFVKKYPWSFATYGAVAGITYALDARGSRRGHGPGERHLPGHRRREGDLDKRASPEAPGAPTRRLLVQTPRGERFLDVDRIDRIEAAGNYVRIHAAEETYLERRTLKSLASQLDPSTFLRIHRSHIVHIDRVARIEPGAGGGHEVALEDGTRLSLSRTYRKRLEERIGDTF